MSRQIRESFTMLRRYYAALLALTVLICLPNCLAQENQQTNESFDLGELLLDLENLPVDSDLPLLLEESVQQVSCQQSVSGSTSEPKPSFPTVRVTGFFQADTGWFDQDAANMVAVGDGPHSCTGPDFFGSVQIRSESR